MNQESCELPLCDGEVDRDDGVRDSDRKPPANEFTEIVVASKLFGCLQRRQK